MNDSVLKRVIRQIVGCLVRWTNKYCCPTYGDVASLSKGPCQRCVGLMVSGAQENPQNKPSIPYNPSDPRNVTIKPLGDLFAGTPPHLQPRGGKFS